MITRLALAAAAALASPLAFATTAGHDDTTYPDVSASWAGTVDASVVGPAAPGDVAYPGAHATIIKGVPPPATKAAWLASPDDTVYPLAAPMAESSGPAASQEQRLACGCTQR